MIVYKVEISRKFRTHWYDRVDGDYWWDVDVYLNDQYNYSLSECGWAKSLNKAKAKALKHILKSSKKIDDGEEYGVIIELKGTAEEIKKDLE